MNYNNNSLENLKDLYTSVVTTKTDQFLSEETEVGEAYKPIGREQENRMYRRAGNLARQSLASKGEKKLTAAKKSARIVSAITRQKEKERFDRIGQDPAHNEEYMLYDVVHDYLISEGFASDTDSANEIILKIDDDLMIEIYERMMTAGEKSKETKLKTKYDPSGMKASMIKQYGAEKGKQVYFATIRKQAMGEAFVDPEQGEAPSGRSPLQNVSDHPKASVRKKAVKAFKSQMGKEYGGTWKSRSKDPVSEAVYGGKKEEPKDDRYIVTNADKKANTKAYQAYKAGSKLYRAADHLKEGDCGCEDKKEPKVKDETGGDIRMVKNKLRAMGLKMSYEPEGEFIDIQEMSEDYLIETVDIATEYFFNEGLNENGLDILIEDMGLENFVDFVFEIGQEYNLTEARTLVGKKKTPATGKELGVSRKAAPGKTTKAAVEKYGTTKKISTSPSSSVIKKKTVAVKKAVEKQPVSKKPVRDAIARGIFGAVKAYQSGMERHRKAMGLAKETGKTVAKVAAVTHEAGRRAGESKIGQAVKKAGSAAIKAGVEKAKKDIQSLKKEEVELLDERKIPVTRQAGEFRYSGRTGEEKAERRAKVLSNSPDPKKRRQANTIRSKIKTVADRDTAQASSDARQKLYRGQQLRANDLAKQLMSKEEVEYISERRKEDKVAGTPRKPRNKAFEIVAKSMGTGRMGVQPRGVKKDKGGPTPGPSITPAERVARIRAARQRSQDNMSSRFD